MDHFKELSTFALVARLGSLSAAARDEGVTPAMIGRRIDQLEERLGVKLFKRSTRQVTLTPEGMTFNDDVQRILHELLVMEESLTAGAKTAAGRLIVTAPTAFGRRHIAPHLPKFMRENPQLTVTLLLSERLVDMKNERVDLAIRIADLRNADLVAVKLARNHRVVCGTPAYFREHGTPERLSDLAKHNCLVISSDEGLADTWWFHERNKAVSVKVSGRMHCNDGGVLTQWAMAGIGIAWRSMWEVNEEIKKGRLITVLDEYASLGNNVYAVFPDRRHLPAKVRLFIEFLKKTFGNPPYWEQ